MPKIPRGKDFVKFLIKFGFELVRQKGSHVILKKQNKTIVVPVHGGEQLRLGLFRDKLKTLELSEEEFWKLF